MSAARAVVPLGAAVRVAHHAARVLPAGSRGRYDAEFDSELHELAAADALRRAQDRVASPWRCCSRCAVRDIDRDAQADSANVRAHQHAAGLGKGLDAKTSQAGQGLVAPAED